MGRSLEEEYKQLVAYLQDSAGIGVKDLLQYADIKQLFLTLVSSFAPLELKKQTLLKILRLYYAAKTGSYSSEFSRVYTYVQWISRIPWETYTKDNVDLTQVREQLNKTHYGLQKVKEKILTYIASLQLKFQKAGQKILYLKNIPVLLFVGLQGLGKTTIAKSIARALGRSFVKISLAAFGDVLQLRGKPWTYPDAEPGMIVQALVKAKSMNPVILLDELDKASANERTRFDIYAALLEVFDPSQNTTFVDKYIDYPIDLSAIFFIATANTIGTMPQALLDRMEIVRFTSYTDEEKLIIAKNYILPKVLQKIGLEPSQLVIPDEVWPLLVRPMGYDAGIRELERLLHNIARYAAYLIVSEGKDKLVLDKENVKKFIADKGGYVI